MANYVFELVGVTPQNVQAVQAALKAAIACRATLIGPSPQGQYFVRVDTELSEDDALADIRQAVGPLGITVNKVTTLPILDVGFKPPKFGK